MTLRNYIHDYRFPQASPSARGLPVENFPWPAPDAPMGGCGTGKRPLHCAGGGRVLCAHTNQADLKMERCTGSAVVLGFICYGRCISVLYQGSVRGLALTLTISMRAPWVHSINNDRHCRIPEAVITKFGFLGQLSWACQRHRQL